MLSEKVIKNKPPWPLLQFLPTGFCLEFLVLVSLTMGCDVGVESNKPFPSQVVSDHGLYHPKITVQLIPPSSLLHYLRSAPTPNPKLSENLQQRHQNAQFCIFGGYDSSSPKAASSPSPRPSILAFDHTWVQTQLVEDTSSLLAYRLYKSLLWFSPVTSPAPISGTGGLTQEFLCSNIPALLLFQFDLIWLASLADISIIKVQKTY